MEFLVGFLVVVIILGALSGGGSFGDVVSRGIGTLLMIIFLLILIEVAILVLN